jgi:hypothetical protein
MDIRTTIVCMCSSVARARETIMRICRGEADVRMLRLLGRACGLAPRETELLRHLDKSTARSRRALLARALGT